MINYFLYLDQGKTLAFVLPILESLINGQNKELGKKMYGRIPSVLVLLPTRELANQVRDACYYPFIQGAWRLIKYFILGACGL